MPTPKYRPIGKDVLRYRVDVPRIIHGHEGALICPHEAVRIHGWFACVPIKPDDVPSRTNGARVGENGPGVINPGGVAVTDNVPVRAAGSVYVLADNVSASIDAKCLGGHRARTMSLPRRVAQLETLLGCSSGL